MKNQSIFLVNSTHKTKTWWMFLSVLVLVFIPFLLVWLLCGEFNLLNNDWLIAKNASVWHGTITAETDIAGLVEKLIKFWNPTLGDMADKLRSAIGGNPISIDSYKTFFDPVILAPLFGLLAWAITYPMLFNATKVSGLDVLPFSSAVGFFMFILIITGLIDQWGQSLLPVYWLLRIFITAVSTFIIFIIANFFTNKYLASRPYAADIYFGYKTIDKANALAKQQLKENVDTFKKQKDQDDSFVEVEEGK